MHVAAINFGVFLLYISFFKGILETFWVVYFHCSGSRVVLSETHSIAVILFCGICEELDCWKIFWSYFYLTCLCCAQSLKKFLWNFCMLTKPSLSNHKSMSALRVNHWAFSCDLLHNMRNFLQRLCLVFLTCCAKIFLAVKFLTHWFHHAPIILAFFLSFFLIYNGIGCSPLNLKNTICFPFRFPSSVLPAFGPRVCLCLSVYVFNVCCVLCVTRERSCWYRAPRFELFRKSAYIASSIIIIIIIIKFLQAIVLIDIRCNL
jgi:hypothetical protein